MQGLLEDFRALKLHGMPELLPDIIVNTRPKRTVSMAYSVDWFWQTAMSMLKTRLNR